MIEVRKALPADFERFHPLIEEWIAECNPDGLRFAPAAEVFIESFSIMAAHPASTTLIMLADGELIGVLGLVRHGWGASKTANFASENLWYVKKEYAGYAAHMVSAAKRWANENGCDYLIFSTNRLASARAGRGEEFLAAAGFRPLYGLHITEVRHV